MSPHICGLLLVLVAQHAVSTAPVGAPETIELFHPEMPPAPARSPATHAEAVPVIHLNTDENGKASVDAYLEMFPQELLTSNKRVKPIEVRKIEHEDFIDYEIEFIELSEEINEDEEEEKETINLILSDSGERFNDTIEDMLSNSDVNKSYADNQSSIKSSSSSSELSQEPKEINLMTFVDLLRRARIRHQSKISSDKRRRRRIKLKRDPVIRIPTDTNDSSNQIDVSQNLKREQNSFSKTNTFSKARELIRNKVPSETNRNSGNRRITLPRYNSFRGRKRIPIKSARNIARNENHADHLIKFRNSQIVGKVGRSSTERTMKRTTTTSSDNHFTDSLKEEDTDKSVVVTRNVTSTRFVTAASSFPVLTSTTPFLEQTEEATESNLDDKLANSENPVKTELYLNMETIKKQRISKPTIMMWKSTVNKVPTKTPPPTTPPPTTPPPTTPPPTIPTPTIPPPIIPPPTIPPPTIPPPTIPPPTIPPPKIPPPTITSPPLATSTSTTTTQSPPPTTTSPATTVKIAKTTLKSSTPRSPAKHIVSHSQLKSDKLNDIVKSRTLTTTIKPIRITTGPSMASTTLMMYPEVFADHSENHEDEDFNHSVPSKTVSLPFSLLSLFGGKAKSSRLEIAPLSTTTYSKTQSSSIKEEKETRNRGKAINGFQNKESFTSLSNNRNLLTPNKRLSKISPVTSASQFSIISTSTQTSIPLFEPTTSAKIITSQLKHEKNNSPSIERYLQKVMTGKPSVSVVRQSSTERLSFLQENFSTTDSTPTSVLTMETDHPELSRTATSPNWMKNVRMTEMKNEYTTDINNMQNQYKYQEVMTSTKVESIKNDNRKMSTPNNSAAAHPEDLQLSESITSVYLHNSPTSQTLTNNVETTESPKPESVNSITLMPYSKLANHMKDTRKEVPTEQPITENIFTVTPQYFALDAPESDKKTRQSFNNTHSEEKIINQENKPETFHPTTDISSIPLETLFSGQYHEISPGQYHEINPGQYEETNPGQYRETHSGQYNELHPGQPGQYHNFEKSYSEDYEVNDVKVDFDHQDEHKIYNVQAKAGDFIIGEVGRIDVSNGQTLEVG